MVSSSELDGGPYAPLQGGPPYAKSLFPHIPWISQVRLGPGPPPCSPRPTQEILFFRCYVINLLPFAFNMHETSEYASEYLF